MDSYPMKRNYENLLSHAIWLKSNNQTTAENAHTLSKLMSKIEFLDSRSIAMSTVEKIIYHYVMNDFRRTPYDDFEQCEYQNAHMEENNDIEKIKYMIAFTCGYDTTYFNEEMKEEMKDFDLRFNFEV